MSLAVLIPVLGRPQRVTPLRLAFKAATPEPYRLVFIASPGDQEEHDEIRSAGCEMVIVDGNYAAKILAGVTGTQEPLLFLGADDLEPQPGWFEAARARIDQGAQVVGVNDLITRRRRPEHATHFLVTREYAERPCVDGSPGPLCSAYSHSFCDDELIGTAKHRGVYVYAPDSHVRHLHPMAGLAEDDETYRVGRAKYFEDRRLLRQRRRLWVT